VEVAGDSRPQRVAERVHRLHTAGAAAGLDDPALVVGLTDAELPGRPGGMRPTTAR